MKMGPRKEEQPSPSGRGTEATRTGPSFNPQWPSTGRLSLLISYPYMVPEVVRALVRFAPYLDLFVDCGAVTAYARGERLSLERYTAFLRALPLDPWGYMALDVIGDPDATMANYMAMKDMGLAPVPVWTRGAPAEHLQTYCSTAKLVAAGGLASKGPHPAARARQVLRLAAGHPIHLLGMTSLARLKTLRPFSADSSSWESAARFGTMDLYLGAGQMVKMRRRNFLGRPTDETLARIRALGFDPYRLQDDAAWRGGKSMTRQISAASWVMVSREMRNKIGTRLFMAAACEEAMMALVAAHIWQTEGARL